MNRESYVTLSEFLDYVRDFESDELYMKVTEISAKLIEQKIVELDND